MNTPTIIIPLYKLRQILLDSIYNGAEGLLNTDQEEPDQVAVDDLVENILAQVNNQGKVVNDG